MLGIGDSRSNVPPTKFAAHDLPRQGANLRAPRRRRVAKRDTICYLENCLSKCNLFRIAFDNMTVKRRRVRRTLRLPHPAQDRARAQPIANDSRKASGFMRTKRPQYCRFCFGAVWNLYFRMTLTSKLTGASPAAQRTPDARPRSMK